MIKSRMRCTGHITCIQDKKMQTQLWYENLKDSDHLEALGTDGRIILK
jgi:hypothetical protein